MKYIQHLSLLVFLSFICFSACKDDIEIEDQPPTVKILNKNEVADSVFIDSVTINIHFQVTQGSEPIESIELSLLSERNSTLSLHPYLRDNQIKVNGEVLKDNNIPFTNPLNTMDYTLTFKIKKSNTVKGFLSIKVRDQKSNQSEDTVFIHKGKVENRFICLGDHYIHPKDTFFTSIKYSNPKHKLVSITVYEDDILYPKQLIINNKLVDNPVLVNAHEFEGILGVFANEIQESHRIKIVFEDEGHSNEQHECFYNSEELQRNENFLSSTHPSNIFALSAIDLETNRLGTEGPMLDIRDMGHIDTLPDKLIWRRSLGPMNGSSVVRLKGNYELNDIYTIQEVRELYHQNIPVDPDKGTGTLEAGDAFIVKQGDKYYFCKIDEFFVNYGQSPFVEAYQLSWKKERTR